MMRSAPQLHALRFTRLAIPSATFLPPTRPRPFSSSSPRHAQEVELDHYKVLASSPGDTKQAIKDRFYELSKLYHPDAASSSSSTNTVEKFQQLSQSWAVLSDDTLRRRYDQSMDMYRSGRRPTYTSGAAHETGSGFGGGAGTGGWNSSSNSSRRDRANYAWVHPARNMRQAAEARDAAEKRKDTYRRGQGVGQSASVDDHFRNFATREARTRLRSDAQRYGPGGNAYSTKGTSSFGEKAEEESRLINDSGVVRSGQVFLVFAGAFGISVLMSGGNERRNGPKR